MVVARLCVRYDSAEIYDFIQQRNVSGQGGLLAQAHVQTAE